MNTFEKGQSAKILACYATPEELEDLEKGHPVGHINAHGKQKQADGSWKYVGKNKASSESSNNDSKSTSSTVSDLTKVSDKDFDALYATHVTSKTGFGRTMTDVGHAVKKELLRREKDPKSKFYLGDDKESSSKPAEEKKTPTNSKKYKKEKYKKVPLAEGQIFHRPDSKPGHYNDIRIDEVMGNKVRVSIVSAAYDGHKRLGDGGVWNKKDLEEHFNKINEGKHERQEAHKELVHNFSHAIGLQKIKGGSLDNMEVRFDLSKALTALAKQVSNVENDSVTSHYGASQLRSHKSGQVLSIDTNGSHYFSSHGGHSPYLIQARIGGAASPEVKKALEETLTSLFKKFELKSALGESYVRTTDGTNWSSVMIGAPSNSKQYTSIPALKSLESIRSK